MSKSKAKTTLLTFIKFEKGSHKAVELEKTRRMKVTVM